MTSTLAQVPVAWEFILGLRWTRGLSGQTQKGQDPTHPREKLHTLKELKAYPWGQGLPGIPMLDQELFLEVLSDGSPLPPGVFSLLFFYIMGTSENRSPCYLHRLH